MKQISNKDYEEFKKYQLDKLYGRIITPESLKLICKALDDNPVEIGQYIISRRNEFVEKNII